MRCFVAVLYVANIGNYTAQYTQAGQLDNQVAPGGVTQKHDYDSMGRLVAMSYLGKVDNAGTAVTVDWMDFRRSYDALDRVVSESTPAVFPSVSSDTNYSYNYDAMSRLSSVSQVDNSVCVTRAYGFDVLGNRVSKTSTVQGAVNQSCVSTSPIESSVSQVLTYNNYSQLTTAGYVYDVFGRATSIPSTDTVNQLGAVTVTYSPENRITSMKQAGVQTDYIYDALGRRVSDKQGATVLTMRHYLDESDNPSWVTGTGTAAGQTDVYTPSLSKGLTAVRKTNGSSTVTYFTFGNLHGDTITSLQLPVTGFMAGPAELNVFDEYGVQQAALLDNRPENSPNHIDPAAWFVLGYGSLGQEQRETTDSGIQFMGARGYNPITGQFLTPDPVEGGNETPYNYPNDPINNSDLNGLLGFLSTLGVEIAYAALGLATIAALCTTIVGCGPAIVIAVGLLTSTMSASTQNILDALKDDKPMKPIKGGELIGQNAFSSSVDPFFERALKKSHSYKKTRSPALRKSILRNGALLSSALTSSMWKLIDINANYNKAYKDCAPIDYFGEWVF